ncbi:MAG: hypothetical protein NT075_15515 [Chloroflexi bacterium]|nr:hypothetical protein [Chloroflexota bacterium]
MADVAAKPALPKSQLPGWDALLLVILVFALLEITGFAEAAALPNRVQDVLRHPILGHLLPSSGMAALGPEGPPPTDPIGLVLFAATLGFLLAYLVVDLAMTAGWRRRAKWILLTAILGTALFLPTLSLMLLRQGSGPASYTHDGGVIQTEAAIQFLLQGKNPYVEDYTKTPMAEWGFNKFRTALYHFPYLPWTFIFSAPFYLLGQALGLYDQRMVYLLLLIVALALAPRLVQGERNQLALVTTLGLNPAMALNVIFGQNDSFVLCWIIFSLVSWRHWQKRGKPTAIPWLSALFFGFACASKPTAWFFAPFYLLLLLAGENAALPSDWRGWLRTAPRLWQRAWPALASFGLLILPYLLWNAFALYDDVWRWSNGQGPTGYQIWGWGASNFVLALGLAPDRFAQWPFGALEAFLGLPLLLWFLYRQHRVNTLANACWHYGLFLLAFFYGSRFLNDNYLGYILAFLALGVFHQRGESGVVDA